jgi:hypothetical protein
MQGPAPAKKTLVETVAAVLQEDIQPEKQGLALRQPPINEDDYDSWAYVKPYGYEPEKWLYVAESVIRAIDRYRAKP